MDYMAFPEVWSVRLGGSTEPTLTPRKPLTDRSRLCLPICGRLHTGSRRVERRVFVSRCQRSLKKDIEFKEEKREDGL